MPSDANYHNNRANFSQDGKYIECQTVEETILQRIRTCLGTRKGDVLGDPNFGINLDDYIFDMSVNKDEIEEEVRFYLNYYAMIGFEDYYTLSVSVHFGHDVTSPTAPHDYFIIDILLNDQRAMGIIVS